jgi:hypothetical protein
MIRDIDSLTKADRVGIDYAALVSSKHHKLHLAHLPKPTIINSAALTGNRLNQKSNLAAEERINTYSNDSDINHNDHSNDSNKIGNKGTEFADKASEKRKWEEILVLDPQLRGFNDFNDDAAGIRDATYKGDVLRDVSNIRRLYRPICYQPYKHPSHPDENKNMTKIIDLQVRVHNPSTRPKVPSYVCITA